MSGDWVLSETAEGETGRYEIQYIFRVGHEKVYGKFYLPGYGTARLFAPGGRIDIRYDPQNSSDSLYDDAWTDEELWAIAIVVLAFLFLVQWLVTGHAWFHLSDT